jgi:hypothetical protein
MFDLGVAAGMARPAAVQHVDLDQEQPVRHGVGERATDRALAA